MDGDAREPARQEDHPQDDRPPQQQLPVASQRLEDLGQRDERACGSKCLQVARIELRPRGKIGNRLKFTPRPRFNQAHRTPAGQALDHQQTHAHCDPVTGGLEHAFVRAHLHINGAHFHAVALCILHQLRRGIKPHGLAIEQGGEKSRRLVALDPGRHIDKQRETRRVRLGKTVFAKTQYLSVNRPGEFGRVAAREHAVDEARFQMHEPALSLPRRHRAAQLVGLAGRKSRRDHGQLHHLFLEDGNTEGAC